MPKFSNPPNQSKGILDDFAVRKNISSKEGTMEQVPTNNNHIVNKLYVDGEIVSKSWLIATDQTGLTGDKTGEFDMSMEASSGSNRILSISADDNLFANFRFLSENGTNRWVMSRQWDAGDQDLHLFRYSDAGANLGSAQSWDRSTGYSTFQNRIILNEVKPTGSTPSLGLITNRFSNVYTVNVDISHDANGTKFKITAEGAYCIELTNKTGSASTKGNLVVGHTTLDDAVALSGTSDANIIGVFLDSSIADGAEAWIVVGGIGDVHMDANAVVRGDRIVSSTATAGRGVANNAPAVAAHFTEIGHCIESGAANSTVRCVLHFL